jgi:hypothetical protein
MRLRRSGDPSEVGKAGRPKNEDVEHIRGHRYSRTVAFKYAKAQRLIGLVCRDAEVAAALGEQVHDASKGSTGRPNVEMFLRAAKLFVGFVAYENDPPNAETMALAVDRADDPHVLDE